ncbi:MAG TPA: penicillin-binding protein activator [Rhodanobacteraceae bacterium]|nr:penicillin-binding protein activator [Rhodanobacteraceae bacterium]
MLLAGCASLGQFTSQSSAQVQSRLSLAETQYGQNHVDAAATTLAEVPRKQLGSVDAARYDTLAAEIALSRGDSARAAALTAHPAPSLPRDLLARTLSVHAHAQEANGDAFGAAHTLARLAPLIPPLARTGNEKQIQRLLMALDPNHLKGEYDTLAEDDPLKPYARAALERLGVAMPQALPQLDHPVGTEVGQGNAITREGYRMPARIALLLPMHGPLAAPAEAVREGFFTGYFGDLSDAARPQVRSYDSGGTPAQVQAAYSQAVADGANLVIGPLTRDSVAAMFSHGVLPVPLLALNHPDGEILPPPGSAEFGLLPEAEGAQAAAHMTERGMHQAIVFVGSDERARRAAGAFKAQFESLGGQVLSEATLGSSNVDYSDAIKAALTNAPPDAGILLLMRPQTARVLMPQLHLVNATQPVFATSLVYAGGDNTTADRDLDGVEFCDAPWLFDAQPGLPDHATIAAQLPDARGAAARLFAFGMDAWALAPYLDWLRTHPGTYVPGAPGQLTEDALGRVHRVPVWASFQDGVARPVAAGLDNGPMMPVPASSSSAQ